MQAPSTFQLIMNISYLFAKIGSLIGVLFWLTACAQESNYNQLLQSNQIESEVPNEPDLGEQQENKPCVTPDGDIVESGQRAIRKWVAFESEVACNGQSALCQDGSWTNNVISPEGAPAFELSLSPDQCTPVGSCHKSSDHMVIQVGITKELCERTWHTGGHWQAVRGNYVVHQEKWNVENTQYLTNTQKSACGISHNTPYCWWED